MNRTILLIIFAVIAFANISIAQKTVYIPNYLKDLNNVDGKQFSWDKTYQTDNFILIWGETVGTDPKSYSDKSLQFDPVAVLDTMEYIYAAFKGNAFLNDSAGTNLAKYKIVIVMYNTWGANGAQGWANGGDVDGVIGAFWVHPDGIRDGGVAAHEFTHSLQSQNNIDYRAKHGLGGAWQNAGIFWETHANYMRNLLYPKAVGAWGMDQYHLETWGDWKNTYENYELLMAIHLSEGSPMIAKIWQEAYADEYPLQAYKRIAKYDQDRFNDSLFVYARRMATFDYSFWGKYFRENRVDNLKNNLLSLQRTYNILKRLPSSNNRFEIPIEQAPEEYAYNLIPLIVDSDSCAVIVKFKGHTDANVHAGWRYGFVAENENGELSRYSPTYSEDEKEINFKLEANEAKLYLVVMGAPKTDITTNTSNDTWHGYPKHFRFPYEISITGAEPEGSQKSDLFRSYFRKNGHKHINGGGWVVNSSTVSDSVFVGPNAMVLGNSNITGHVIVDNTSVVVNSSIKDQANILDNAFVIGSNISENAIVAGHAYVENVTMSGSAKVWMRANVLNYKLSGTAEVGGDVVVYNQNGDCDNGVQYVMTNYYDDKLLDCDGKTANSQVNKDVNNKYSLFTDEEMKMKCNCENLPDCKTTSSVLILTNEIGLPSPNPTRGIVSLAFGDKLNGKQLNISILDVYGRQLKQQDKVFENGKININLEDLQSGIYYVLIESDHQIINRSTIVKID